METLSARLARMGPSRPTDAPILTVAQKRAFNDLYEQDPIPPWALFILLVSEYRFITFYRTTKLNVEPFELEPHILWNTVLLMWRTALRRTEVDAFLKLLPVASGAIMGARGDAEETEDVIETARNAIPPEVRELLRMAVYDDKPGGYVNFRPPKGVVFWTRYLEMRDGAYRLVRKWFGEKGVEYDTSVFGDVDSADDEDEANAAPELPPPKEDEAPCPDRDRPPGDDPQPPCGESEEQEFERLAKELLGASTEDIAAALIKLAARRGCGSPKRFCMSRHGEALGVCDDQELWRLMCEEMGWASDPPVLRTEQVTPDRRVYTNGDEPRLVLAIRLADSHTSVREIEPEYTMVRGEQRTLYDWHAQYMMRCVDKP